METDAHLHRCFSYLSAQYQESHPPWETDPTRIRMSVTISREAGARGHSVGGVLASILQAENKDPMHPWLMFDHELVSEVIKEHKLPLNAAAYMREEQPVSEIEGLVGEILGLHPSTSELIERSHQTIRRLAKLGHVIIVGRGGNYLTLSMQQVIQVRLVGDLENRARYIAETYEITRAEARSNARKIDRARAAYVSKYMSRSIDDPHGYDLIINTDHFSNESAGAMIAAAVRERKRVLEVQNRRRLAARL